MQETSNYQLAQWDGSDRILREVFNSDNAKVDAAIAAVQAEVAGERAARAAEMEAARAAWEAALAGERAARERAVAAARAENRLEKLVDVTTREAANQVDVDVSKIDFMQYVGLELHVDAAGISAMRLLVNNTTSYRANTTSSQDADELVSFGVFSSTPTGYVRFMRPQANSNIHCQYFGSSSRTLYDHYSVAQDCQWKDLATLNLISYPVPAGSRIFLYGVRR